MLQFFRDKLVTVVVVLGGAVLLTILYFTYNNTRHLIEAENRIQHTQQVLIESDKLAMAVKDVQVNGRVYLVTRDESLLATVSKTEQAAVAHLDKLAGFVSDNPSQAAKVDSLRMLFGSHTGLNELSSPREHLFVESKQYEDDFMLALSSFQQEENRLLEDHKALSNKAVVSFEIFLVVLIAVLIILVVLVLLSVRWTERLRDRVYTQSANLRTFIKELSDYKHALDESAIVAITDRRGIITHANDNFCKISKYTRKELIGQHHGIVNSSLHSKEFFQQLWSTIANGKIWKGELRNQARDGTYYWVDTSIVPFLDKNGRPYQYLAIRFDITERKIAEEIRAANQKLAAEVREKQAELAGVLDRITDGFMELDKEFNYVYVNKRLGEMTHQDPSSMIGRNAWDLFPEVVDSPSFKAIKLAIREQRYITQMDYYPPLGLWHESHIYPSEQGVSIFVRDMSKQMQAEQRLLQSERLYRTIASSIPGSVIVVVDHELRYTLIEGDLVDRLGYVKEDILGKKADEVLLKERFDEIRPYFERSFKGESFSVEIHRNGYDLLTRYVPLHNENNEVYSVMVVSIDVTALKAAQRETAEINSTLEQKIAERTAQLESANKELESFSYSIAHDLRSPLRAVMGYTSMLIEDYSSKLDLDGNKLLSDVERNANRMSKQIDDLLTFSRLGRKEVRRSVVDMDVLIDDVLKEVNTGNARMKLQELHPVFGDMSLIKHVMLNLLSNAVKYSSRKEQPEITISSVSDNGIITYSIKDNGVGFDMQYAENLFGVFRRLHSAEEFEGTGVGLAIVQRIINRHGGQVWAHAKVNEGATFFFTLPAIPRI